MTTFSIELDCPPGGTRPGDLISGVVAGTPAEAILGDTVSRFFGNWEWRFELDDKVWDEEVVPVVKPRIEALYNQGVIRYASW